jgi:hypothetical protein
MSNRWIGIACIACMLSANTALLLRDIVPVWFAPEPPKPASLSIAPGETLRIQVGIFNERGERIGVSRTDAHPFGERITISTQTQINDLPLPRSIFEPPLKVISTLSYTRAAGLDALDIKVSGFGRVALSGESYPGGDFVCEWHLGEDKGRFVLPIEATRALGDAIRPFETLPNLFVGRTWRVEIFQPLASLLNSSARSSRISRATVVSVTGEEMLDHGGESMMTFRVEGPHIRAWVTPAGRVLKQEVNLPILGRLTLVDEPWTDPEMRYKRRSGRSDRSGSPAQ